MKTIDDLEWDFFSANADSTENKTINDLKHEYYSAYSADPVGKTLDELEFEYFSDYFTDTSYMTLNDMKYLFYKDQSSDSEFKTIADLEYEYFSKGNSIPAPPIALKAIPGLEAAFLDRNVLGVGVGNNFKENSPVGLWYDSSGKGRDLKQNDSSKRPIYRRGGVNLLTPNQAILTASNCTADQATISDDNGWLKSVSQGTGNPSVVVNGPASSTRLDIMTGQQITLSVTARIDAPLTQIGGRSRCIEITYYDQGAWVSPTIRSDQFPNVAGTYRISVTAIIPETATGSFVRLSNYGSNGDTIYWKDLQLELGDTATPWIPPDNKPGLQFDGIDDFLQVSENIPTDNVTVYVVGETFSKGLSQQILDARPNGDSPGFDILSLNTSNRAYWRVGRGGSESSITSADTVSASTRALITASSSISFNRLYINGNLSAEDTSLTVPIDSPLGSLVVGRQGLASQYFFNGIIHAILICSEAHDDETREKIENWLMDAYGIGD